MAELCPGCGQSVSASLDEESVDAHGEVTSTTTYEGSLQWEQTPEGRHLAYARYRLNDGDIETLLAHACEPGDGGAGDRSKVPAKPPTGSPEAATP